MLLFSSEDIGVDGADVLSLEPLDDMLERIDVLIFFRLGSFGRNSVAATWITSVGRELSINAVSSPAVSPTAARCGSNENT